MGRTSFSGNDLTSRRDETIRTESSWGKTRRRRDRSAETPFSHVSGGIVRAGAGEARKTSMGVVCASSKAAWWQSRRSCARTSRPGKARARQDCIGRMPATDDAVPRRRGRADDGRGLCESVGGDARIRTGDKGFAGLCLTTWPRRRLTKEAGRTFRIRPAPYKRWSGRRGSNPRPRPWQGRALPAEPRPHAKRYYNGFPPTAQEGVSVSCLFLWQPPAHASPRSPSRTRASPESCLPNSLRTQGFRQTGFRTAGFPADRRLRVCQKACGAEPRSAAGRHARAQRPCDARVAISGIEKASSRRSPPCACLVSEAGFEPAHPLCGH